MEHLQTLEAKTAAAAEQEANAERLRLELEEARVKMEEQTSALEEAKAALAAPPPPPPQPAPVELEYQEHDEENREYGKIDCVYPTGMCIVTDVPPLFTLARPNSAFSLRCDYNFLIPSTSCQEEIGKFIRYVFL